MPEYPPRVRKSDKTFKVTLTAKEQNVILQRKLDEAAKEAEQLTSRNTVLENRITQLNASLGKMMNDGDQMRSEINQLTEQRDMLRDDLEQMTMFRDFLKLSLDGANHQISGLNNTVSILQQTIVMVSK